MLGSQRMLHMARESVCVYAGHSALLLLAKALLHTA